MNQTLSGSLWIFLLLSFGLLVLPSCGGADGAGGSSREYVYLHVFNGYPGASSVTIYGPSGSIVDGLPYGARTPRPVRVDRNLGSQFLFVLDGAPQTFDADATLFSMYPAETGTLFVSRRMDGTVRFEIFRHIPSISENCRLVMANALPTSNEGLGVYSFAFAWNFGRTNYSVPQAGYVPGDPRLDDDPNFLSRIEDYPYFFLVELEDDRLGWLWVGPEETIDPPRVDFESSSIKSPPPTSVVVECLSELEEPEEPTPPPGGSTFEEILAYEEAYNDYLQAFAQFRTEEAQCKAPREYTFFSVHPGLDHIETVHINPRFQGPSDSCDAQIRIFSDFGNIFDGDHGSGSRRDFDVSYGSADHFFAVLYGFPVDPRMATWKTSDAVESGGGFEGDLSAFDP
jgi:hypothetical protein